jgi:hypothetical protein
MNRFVSLSTQEEEFHHGSLLMAINFNQIKASLTVSEIRRLHIGGERLKME